MIIMLLGSMPTKDQIKGALENQYPECDIQTIDGFLFPSDCLLISNKNGKAAIINMNSSKRRISIIGVNGKHLQKFVLFMSMILPNIIKKIPFEREIVKLFENQFEYTSSIAV